MGAWREVAQVREAEALHVAAIRSARRCIYMENQYFTAPLIADELAKRLKEADGPEVVLISAEHSPSYFDQMTMDRTRVLFLKTLQQADRHGRLQAYSQVTTLGRTIIVHSKLTIIDDTLLRVGSANINNRSMGFDTECDLTLRAVNRDHRAEITRLRNVLVAHWLGCAAGPLDEALRRDRSLGKALERLRTAGYARLRPIETRPLKALPRLIAESHLGDPVASKDAWRPWAREAASAWARARYG